uniref:NADH-ubiquinone oxidoreductase chain 6 n=1 Tax=Blastocladiella sp. TaxID=2169676 RepID=A0A890JEB4_9FUNG|nr:NADH dehydrogenase subunit 6 [Blastocladiella sp.]
MTLTWGIFNFLSASTIISGALTVVMGRNPINSVVGLVSCFVSCSSIFILMGGTAFLGFIYIIVYVGAIAILFIFVIMMMDLRNLTAERKNSVQYSFLLNYPLALIIAISAILWGNTIQIEGPIGEITSSFLNDFTTWEIAQRNIWDVWAQTSSMGSTGLHTIGYLLYTDFLALLLLASLILLMVMVSVIALVKIPAAEGN